MSSWNTRLQVDAHGECSAIWRMLLIHTNMRCHSKVCTATFDVSRLSLSAGLAELEVGCTRSQAHLTKGDPESRHPTASAEELLETGLQQPRVLLAWICWAWGKNGKMH